MGVVIYAAKAASYVFPGHPERPERVLKTAEQLRSAGYSFLDPQPCADEDLLRVHSTRMLAKVREGSFQDPDTPWTPDMEPLSRLSAGGAILAMEEALRHNPAFSLMRPPGHHSGKDSPSGFCYYNVMAVAAAKAVKQRGCRVAIVDIDVHHGNGTEEIFSGWDNVLYCSLHQYPLYPGTGGTTQGNCLNVPLLPDTDESIYLHALDQALLSVAAFSPDLIAVSAGFDAYREDPLALLRLDQGTYRKIGQRLAGLANRRFAVLEGGYSRDLPQCISEFLQGFF